MSATPPDNSDTGFLSKKPVSITLMIIGAIVVLAHIVGAIWLGLTMSKWMSGAAIGLFLVIFALAHLFIPSHTRNRVVNMNKQLLYWLISLVAGFVGGLMAVVLVPFIGWFVVIPGAAGAVTVGRYLDGNPKTKAVRLLLYGLAGGLTYLNSVAPGNLPCQPWHRTVLRSYGSVYWPDDPSHCWSTQASSCI